MSDRACHRCGRAAGTGRREVRPYGPGGAWICAGCVMGEGGAKPDPAVRAEAVRQFGARVDRAAVEPDGVVIYDTAAQTMIGVRRGKS